MPKSSVVYKLLIACIFFWSASLSAQEESEVLKKTISNPKVHDTTKLNALAVLLGNVYDAAEFDRYNAQLGKLALKGLSRKDNADLLQKKYKKYLGDYYGNLSVRYEEDGNPESLRCVDKSIFLYRQIGAQDELYMAIVNKGLILYQRKEYKKAIDCYFEALRYFEQHPEGNEDNIWYVYSNLGILSTEQGQHREAIKYYKKATHFIDMKNEKATVEDELQKSNLYINLGFCHIALKQYDEAAKNLNVGLALARKHEPNPYVSLALGRLGLIDLKRKDYDAAEQKLTEAYQLSEEGFSKALTLIDLGEVYYRKADYAKADAMLEKGVQSAKAANHTKLLMQAYRLLYLVNKARGNYKKAIAMLESYHKYTDSAKMVDARNQIKQRQLKYDYEKKELNLKLENERKNNLLIILSALFLLLFVIGFFFYKNYKQKQAIANYEKNELNRKLLLSQMNPHFIFNSIDNIQSLIYNKQDKEAVNYLTKFSKLTRQILENSNESFISLSEELAMIENYLAIQQLLHNNKFDFTIKVDGSIDMDAILLPPMLTQPFIENSIRHGLKNTVEKGKIDIDFKFADEKLFFEITDNGAGFGHNETINRKSMAMKITGERLVNISGKSDFEVTAENILDDKKSVAGARVFFELPYVYEH